jgi:predicted nucleotidyltransferase
MAQRVVGAFLSGSYARKTAIAPLDDVDIIFIIDPERWNTGLFSTLPDPSKILKTFGRAIRHRYSESSVRTQRRSVRLQLYHLDIDVVPAVTESEEDPDILLIPDANEGEWIRTAPKLHAEATSELNAETDGLFIPLVKLLKLWNSQIPQTATFKSFAIETMATRIIQHHHIESLPQGVLMFFDLISKYSGEQTIYDWNDDCGVHLGRLWPTVPDTTPVQSNIVKGIDSKRRKRFIQNALRSRNNLAQAMDARTPTATEKHVRKSFRINAP